MKANRGKNMNKRLINVIKWFLMILGGLFIIQLLLVFAVIYGFIGFSNADLNFINTDKKIKPIEPIIKYVEDYRLKNGKYPEKIEGVKLKKDIDYKYDVSNNGNCYSIVINSKKDNSKKHYQYCQLNSQNSSSKSESYVEYKE